MRLLFSLRAAACGAVFCAAVCLSIAARADDQTLIWTDQGPGWDAAARTAFYSQDQGSRIMPLAWLNALKRRDGQPFLADGLARYGYLPNPASGDGLPVGFTSSSWQGDQFAGMSCAACHTRQISVAGKDYRIDGGPAIVDFQSFLADLDAAVAGVLSDPAAFDEFAGAVLGPAPQPDGAAQLRDRVAAWQLRYHTIMARALPDPPWGYGRLDAVSMIFNRLAGLDLGQPPSHLIPDNIERADAPVRYPFLWNAALQDKTQWPGFEDNGVDQLAMPRNVGEVMGMFGVFEPDRSMLRLLGFNYLNNSSINFDGLKKLEGLMKEIGPPRWPWPVDAALAERARPSSNARRRTAAARTAMASNRGACSFQISRPGRLRLRCRNRFAGIRRLGAEGHSGVLEVADSDRSEAVARNRLYRQHIGRGHAWVHPAEPRSFRHRRSGDAARAAREISRPAVAARPRRSVPFDAGHRQSQRRRRREASV